MPLLSGGVVQPVASYPVQFAAHVSVPWGYLPSVTSAQVAPCATAPSHTSPSSPMPSPQFAPPLWPLPPGAGSPPDEHPRKAIAPPLTATSSNVATVRPLLRPH